MEDGRGSGGRLAAAQRAWGPEGLGDLYSSVNL